ncbi:hypothetical protein V8V74_25080 [Niallia taxi]
MDGGQLLIQYKIKQNKMEKNTMVAGSSKLLISNPFKQSNSNIINNNVYYLSDREKETRLIWETNEIKGFSRKQPGQ